jgi:hypothetical protein
VRQILYVRKQQILFTVRSERSNCCSKAIRCTFYCELLKVLFMYITETNGNGYNLTFFFLLPPYSGARSHIGAHGWLLSSLSFTGGRTPWTGDQVVARPLLKHRTTQTQKNADTH